MTQPPTSLRVSSDRRTLTIAFGEAEQAVPAELLRVESPSAEVQGHDPSQKVVVRGKEHVRIERIEPVGHYAVRIVFDDGHDTGLYTWDTLRRFAERRDELMDAYRKAVS